jgi:hypothetical protein
MQFQESTAREYDADAGRANSGAAEPRACNTSETRDVCCHSINYKKVN